MDERISWANIARFSGNGINDYWRLIVIDEELGIPRNSFLDIRWRRASRTANLTFHLRFDIADLFSKCRSLGLGDGLTRVGLFPTFHGIGGIEEKFGGLLNMAIYIICMDIQKRSPASIMLAFMLAAYCDRWRNLCFQTGFFLDIWCRKRCAVNGHSSPLWHCWHVFKPTLWWIWVSMWPSQNEAPCPARLTAFWDDMLRISWDWSSTTRANLTLLTLPSPVTYRILNSAS